MPLRDHFLPPAPGRTPWEAVHALLPGILIQHLFPLLPDGYVAEPGVHIGQPFEVDVATYERDGPPPVDPAGADAGGGVATLARPAPPPTMTLETAFADQDEFTVRVYDRDRARRLVAAVELVSPGNKDRPDNRRAFAGKAAAFVQQGVCVAVVDLVTVPAFNLYAEVLGLIGGTDAAAGPHPPPTYCATMRRRARPPRRAVLDAWFDPLAVGRSLPVVPLWLADEVCVRLDLEPAYEETCRLLHIR